MPSYHGYRYSRHYNAAKLAEPKRPCAECGLNKGPRGFYTDPVYVWRFGTSICRACIQRLRGEGKTGALVLRAIRERKE